MVILVTTLVLRPGRGEEGKLPGELSDTLCLGSLVFVGGTVELSRNFFA